MDIENLNISDRHFEELKAAKLLLENPGLAVKLTNMVGKPIEIIFQTLPEKWRGRIHEITQNSLLKAIEFLSKSFESGSSIHSQESKHKLAVVASGAIGGAFGLGALTFELPISTIIMLRSIMDIARSEGEIVETSDAQMACMEVFALGGTSRNDDSTELGYYAVRMALARSLSEAADYIVERGLAEKGAPIIVRFMTKIASRFGVVVSEKAAVQSIPLIGSVMGASINAAFIDHFQNVARGHFIVRKLERVYGKERIENEYKNIIFETA